MLRSFKTEDVTNAIDAIQSKLTGDYIARRSGGNKAPVIWNIVAGKAEDKTTENAGNENQLKEVIDATGKAYSVNNDALEDALKAYYDCMASAPYLNTLGETVYKYLFSKCIELMHKPSDLFVVYDELNETSNAVFNLDTMPERMSKIQISDDKNIQVIGLVDNMGAYMEKDSTKGRPVVPSTSFRQFVFEGGARAIEGETYPNSSEKYPCPVAITNGKNSTSICSSEYSVISDANKKNSIIDSDVHSTPLKHIYYVPLYHVEKNFVLPRAVTFTMETIKTHVPIPKTMMSG